MVEATGQAMVDDTATPDLSLDDIIVL